MTAAAWASIRSANIAATRSSRMGNRRTGWRCKWSIPFCVSGPASPSTGVPFRPRAVAHRSDGGAPRQADVLRLQCLTTVAEEPRQPGAIDHAAPLLEYCLVSTPCGQRQPTSWRSPFPGGP